MIVAPKRFRFFIWPARRVKLYIRAAVTGFFPGRKLMEDFHGARFEYYADKLADIRSEKMVAEIGQATCEALWEACNFDLIRILTR